MLRKGKIMHLLLHASNILGVIQDTVILASWEENKVYGGQSNKRNFLWYSFFRILLILYQINISFQNTILRH
jgi:hypothetical protein